MIYEVYGTNGWKKAATKSDEYENDDFCGGTESFDKNDSRVLSEDDLWPMSDNENKQPNIESDHEIEVDLKI